MNCGLTDFGEKLVHQASGEEQDALGSIIMEIQIAIIRFPAKEYVQPDIKSILCFFIAFNSNKGI